MLIEKNLKEAKMVEQAKERGKLTEEEYEMLFKEEYPGE